MQYNLFFFPSQKLYLGLTATVLERMSHVLRLRLRLRLIVACYVEVNVLLIHTQRAYTDVDMVQSTTYHKTVV